MVFFIFGPCRWRNLEKLIGNERAVGAPLEIGYSSQSRSQYDESGVAGQDRDLVSVSWQSLLAG